jgi:flagellin
MEKLSSGFRVNRAGDDAAGLAISEKMRSQIRGLNMASKNSQDAISLIQTAEGGLGVVQDIAQRIRELTVQGASETNTQEDRNAIAIEVEQLCREIRHAENIEFNERKIFIPLVDANNRPNNNSIEGMIIQVGANENQTLTFSIDPGDLRIPSGYRNDAGSTDARGVNDPDLPNGAIAPDLSLIRVTESMLNHVHLALRGAYGANPIAGSYYNYSGDNANDYDPAKSDENPQGDRTQTEWISFMIGNVDAAIHNISLARSQLGALQNRLEFKIQNLDNQAENISASESRIRGADMAKQMTEFTKNNILFQASTAMLAQANSLPQSVLQLLA